MKSLCTNATQRAHLAKLVGLIRNKTLTGTEAWSAFSAPKSTKVFALANGQSKTVLFNLSERKFYDALREEVQNKLLEQYGRMCAYCRRPVGHYGYSWNIEHVLPKSVYRSYTFKLSNLTIGCVDCNRWKGARVDKKVRNKALPIINPVEEKFQYAKHLKYLHIGTENFNFVKYRIRSPYGKKTYELLSFDELERAHALNSMDPLAAALHDRLTRAMYAGLSVPEGEQFLALLGNLKSSIYRRS